MNLDDHVIVTGTDGVLDRSTPEDVRRIVAAMAASERAVVHLHGGLVAEDGALQTAGQLRPVYRDDAGAYPVFMVYRTGLLEIVGGHLKQIATESVFRTLLARLLKYAVGKLTTDDPAKSLGAANLPRDRDVRREMQRTERGEEPFGDLEAGEPSPLADEEAERFARELEGDAEFQGACKAVAAAVVPESERGDAGARGLGTVRAAPGTLLSPAVVDELAAETRGGTKGVLSTALLVKRAVAILRRVVARHVARRDHGLYATVVEELLRELYLANVGAAVWHAMKSETSDTFATDGAPRGGSTFVRALGEQFAAGRQPAISVVAHSLGSVYACRLIEHLAACRDDPAHPLPDDFTLAHLVFLAPAVDCGLFAAVLDRHRDLFRDFRMFALGDDLEAGYWEVPGVYPRSLLYLVSGLFERDGTGRAAVDRPLVGMERYLTREEIYEAPEVATVRAFLTGAPHRAVWAPASLGPGLTSTSATHGAFDDPPPANDTMRSVCAVLRGGGVAG